MAEVLVCPSNIRVSETTAYILGFSLSLGSLTLGKPAAMSSGHSGSPWRAYVTRKWGLQSRAREQLRPANNCMSLEVFKWLQSQLTASQQPHERPWTTTSQLSFSQQLINYYSSKATTYSSIWYLILEGFV